MNGMLRIKIQSKRIKVLRAEINSLLNNLTKKKKPPNQYPFKYIFNKTHNLSIETQELVASILIEFAPDNFNGIEECLANPNEPKIVGSMLVSELSQIIKKNYDWVLKLNLKKRKFQYILLVCITRKIGTSFRK